MTDKFYKCHLVSKVLLKQFSKDNKVDFFDKKTNKWIRNQKINKLPAFTYLPTKYFHYIDQKWGKKIESRIGIQLQKHKGDLISIAKDKNGEDRLKELMILHFLRSKSAFQSLVEKIHESSLEVEEQAGINQKNNFLEQSLLNSPKIIEDLFEKIKKESEKYTIEIAYANRRTKFTLGDTPIINLQKDENSLKTYLGIKQGVGFKASQTFVLPFSPDIAISLYSEKRLWSLKSRDIRNVNKFTKKISERYIFAKPI